MKRIAIILLMSCVALIAYFLLLRYQGPSTRKVILVSGSVPCGRELSFQLLDKPIVKHARGHPHSPFGIVGRDVYRYNGDVLCDGRKAHLSVDGMVPVLMVMIDGQYYLLTQGYFSWTRDKYQWCRIVGDRWEEANVDVVPACLAAIVFTDKADTYMYRVYWLKQLLLHYGCERTSNQIVAYSQLSPRFFLDLDDKHDGSITSGMIKWIGDYAIQCNDSRVDAAIEWTVTHAGPTDDESVFAALCRALLAHNRSQAESILCRLSKEWRHGNPLHDMRAAVFKDSIEFLEWECPDEK